MPVLIANFSALYVIFIKIMVLLSLSACFDTFGASLFSFLNFTLVWLRITDEGSVPEIRIWWILLTKYDLKWFIILVEVSFHIRMDFMGSFNQFNFDSQFSTVFHFDKRYLMTVQYPKDIYDPYINIDTKVVCAL